MARSEVKWEGDDQPHLSKRRMVNDGYGDMEGQDRRTSKKWVSTKPADIRVHG